MNCFDHGSLETVITLMIIIIIIIIIMESLTDPAV